MTTRLRSRICAGFASVAVFVLSVAPAAAASVWVDAFAQSLDTPVSRGEFIRATVDTLGVPKDVDVQLPYMRPVPLSYKPFVAAAYNRGALAQFGDDLNPARDITMGEALQIIVHLQKFEPQKLSSFTDVPAGSELERAVSVGMERDWVTPARGKRFGPDRVLNGATARLLLRKVTGEDDVDPDAEGGTTYIRFKTRVREPLPQQDVLQSVWTLLQDQYLRSDKIDANKAAYSAAEAMVQSLDDPYTTFLRPVNAQEFQSRLEGKVTGIGAQVEQRNGLLIIVAPLPQSPAQRAGLQAGDEIVAADGVTMAGLSFVEAVSHVRGEEGTSVRLTIKREGSQFDVHVVRAVINVPEVDVSWQGNIAVVHLVQFGERTERELRSIMQDINDKHPRGVILDIRNNPGGLLDAATVVLSNFLPKGSAVVEIKTRDDAYSEETLDPPTLDAGIPVVVLANKGSASSSEIVAGALQDYARATIVGERTFGKGTVQQVVDFKDGSSLKMTIAEWFTPKHRKIDGVGIAPDFTVTNADVRDEQMLRALDILR